MKSGLFFFFGVLVPFVTFAIELFTGFCANHLFDPMPTAAHVLLVALGPSTMLAWFLSKRHDAVKRWPLLLFLSGASLGVALYYCGVFGVLAPVGVIGVIWFGIGLLPLTPFLSFFASLAAWRRLRSLLDESELPSKAIPLGWIGFVSAVVAVGVLELAAFVTHTQIARVELRSDPVTIEKAAQIVRWFGSETTLHRSAFRFDPRFTGPTGFLFGLVESRRNSNAAELLYFRVTGKSPTERLPMLRPMVGTGQNLFTRGDQNLGGDAVAQRIEGVALQSSSVNAEMNGDSELAYQEWTMEISNAQATAQEGRFQVLLPPGSVVSRLTLWVNDEPREAAFAHKSKVTEAYRSVAVVQRKDPVLVRWISPDRFFVQCFPIPANGGVMKFRIGFISPVEDGRLKLPLIAERNFEVSKRLAHTIRYQSDRPFVAGHPNLEVADRARGGWVMMGQLRDADFSSPAAAMTIEPGPAPDVVWTSDPFAVESERILVREHLPVPEPANLEPMMFVVDTSEAIRPHRDELVEALLGFPEDLRFGLVLASDEPVTVLEFGLHDATARAEAAQRIAKERFLGGIDNAEALRQALRQPAQVVWIHGPQPVATGNGKPNLMKMIANDHCRSSGIHSISVKPGTNYLLSALTEQPILKSDQRVWKLDEDLERLVQTLAQRKTDARRWSRQADVSNLPPEAKGVDDILARYWAFEETLSRFQIGAPSADFAAEYQLVTPFSGAVVLETAEQFEQHGLTPVDADLAPDTPSVPEPETYLLLLIVALAAGYQWWRMQGGYFSQSGA